MDVIIETGTIFGELTAIRKDHSRRTRDGKGFYWRCVCVCNKVISVKDTDLIRGKQVSCKPVGRPCKQVRIQIIKCGDIFRDHNVIMKLEESGPVLKSYYLIACLSCGKRSQKRGDTLLSGKFAICSCQSTENQNKSS